jgi:hypothetical protein
MAKPVSNIDAEKFLACLFPVGETLPCPEGKALLVALAEALSADFTFLKSIDFVDDRNSGCAGTAESDAFSEHYGSCERYDA